MFCAPLCQSLSFVIFPFTSSVNPIQFPEWIIVWVVAAAKTGRRKDRGRKIILLSEEESSSILCIVQIISRFLRWIIESYWLRDFEETKTGSRSRVKGESDAQKMA